MNITAVEPAAKGFLRGGSGCIIIISPCNLPNATLLNYSTALNASNGVDVPVCLNWGGGIFIPCGSAFQLGTFGAKTDVVVDVTGYYASPIFGIVDGDPVNDADVAFRRQSGFTSVTRTSTGNFILDPVDDLRGCALEISATSSDSDDAVGANHVVTADMQPDGDIDVDLRTGAGTAVNDEFTVVVSC